MRQINQILFESKPKRIISERTHLIQSIADSVGVPFNNVFKEVFHLKSEWGNKILHNILEDVLMTGEDMNFRASKLRELVNKSRPTANRTAF
jgi:hypothetical protein